jgi:predicted naringenin-chalcone synthase
MTMSIVGIGTAVPPHRIAQTDAAGIAQGFACTTSAEEKLLQTLYRRAGVEGRSSVILDSSDGPLETRQSFYGTTPPTTLARMRKYEASAGSLALAAVESALQDARLAPERVTHLLTVSCSGFYSPGFDIHLIKETPLPCHVARTHIGFMGCQGALNGLRLASAFGAADPSSCVLLCALELCSLHHQYGWDAENIVANALFGDGAAAAVFVPSRDSSRQRYRLVASGSIVIPESADAMSWRIGDQGFEMTLSTRVPDLIYQHLGSWLRFWLAGQNLDMADVGSWAVHPGGPRILAAVAEALELPRQTLEVSYQVLAEHGNMSSPTILFILDLLSKADAARPCVALAFGPGLTIEAALLS